MGFFFFFLEAVAEDQDELFPLRGVRGDQPALSQQPGHKKAALVYSETEQQGMNYERGPSAE